MFALRRTAARAIASSPSKVLFAKPRSITTFSPSVLKPRQQQTIASLLQRRWISDEAAKTGAAATQENFAQTAAEAPVDENLTPAQPATSEVPADTGAEVLESAVAERSSRPRSDNAPNLTLYVGNLFFEVTPEQLKRVFSRFGEIKDVKIIYDNRGMSRGFGYVEFEKIDDAQTAIDNLDMQVFEGRNLVVQFHRPRNNTRPSREENAPSKTLFIGNMSFEMSDKDLNDLFREIRNVMDVRVAIDRRTGQPRGFAHADFIDVASATKAKEILQGKELYGRGLRVDFSASGTQQQRTRRDDQGGNRERRRPRDN